MLPQVGFALPQGHAQYTDNVPNPINIPSVGYRSFQQTQQSSAGSLNPTNAPQQSAGYLNPNDTCQTPFLGVNQNTNYGPGSFQSPINNVGPGFFQSPIQVGSGSFQYPSNVSLGSVQSPNYVRSYQPQYLPARPTYYHGPIPSTPVHKPTQMVSPFASPHALKNKGESIPQSLYFNPTRTSWEEFYSKFHNYARDKHWTSDDCKSNIMLMLEGKAHEYFVTLNEHEPNLEFYDIVSRMEDQFTYRKMHKISQMTNLESSLSEGNQVSSTKLVGDNQSYHCNVLESTPLPSRSFRDSQPYTCTGSFLESTPLQKPPLEVSRQPVYNWESTPTHGPPPSHDNTPVLQTLTTEICNPPSFKKRKERYVSYMGPESPSPKHEDENDNSSSTKASCDDMMSRLEQSFEKMMTSIMKANEAKYSNIQDSSPTRNGQGSPNRSRQDSLPTRNGQGSPNRNRQDSSPTSCKLANTEANNENKYKEVEHKSTLQPRSKVNKKSVTQSPCIGCNAQGHYLWECTEKKVLFQCDQEEDWELDSDYGQKEEDWDLNFQGSDPEA